MAEGSGQDDPAGIPVLTDAAGAADVVTERREQGADPHMSRAEHHTTEHHTAGRRVAEAERRVGEARRRLWAADTACYYAHRRYARSRSEADRRLWTARSGESGRAVAELEGAERVLALAREALSGTEGGRSRPAGDGPRMRVVRLRGGGHGLSS